ncbi:EAL domain-containing protein [Argonema antarcticum]|uniref:EAL domain-containing protein n=1 Tax=Argonema antarcticum TaxID=2942763 RepID=UPI0020111D64|nr:EAL domain-containing protein [Argonema antarcticum]MCL1470128.1 EAL domain-containing protein [Argonema antarcticum A004/B2]
MNKIDKGLGCTRCETLPTKIEGKGTLYIWFPVVHTLNKLISALGKTELDYQLLEDEQCLKILLEPNNLEGFITIITARLTSKELKETQVLWMALEAEPLFRHFSRVTSLNSFMSLSKCEWLLDILAQERLTCHFQPIVYAEDTSRIFGQEALLRGFDDRGNLISPGRIFTNAQDAGMVFQVDALARQMAIREANRHGIEERIFINFSPTAVYDPNTCLRMTVRAIGEAGIPHSNVVFEVMESEQPPDINHLIKIMKFYQEAGFLIALDDFGTGYSNLNLIHELRPDFIKLDRQLIQNVHQDPYKALITEKLLEIAHKLDIKTIAEGIESLEELEWVRSRGANFVQGFLIAKPITPPVRTTPSLGSEAMFVSA